LGYSNGGSGMTRINIISVKELSREHLIAEYREITRLPKNLIKSLNRKSKPFSMEEIPTEYKLGQGHVKFFYDKMLFLQNRFEQLVNEMLHRGYKPNYTDSNIFIPKDKRFYNDYNPTQKAIELNRKRIEDRTTR
jgi:hypothetical protein